MNEGIGHNTSRPQSRTSEDNRDITDEVPVINVPTEEQPLITTLPNSPEPIASGSRQTMPGGLPIFNTSVEPGDITDFTVRTSTPGRPSRLPDFDQPFRRSATVGPEEEMAEGATSRPIDETSYVRHPLSNTWVPRSIQSVGREPSQISVPQTPNTESALSSLTDLVRPPSLTGTEVERRFNHAEAARAREQQREAREMVREVANEALRPIQEQITVRTISLPEINQNTHAIMQSAVTTLEQIRGINDNLDRVRDEAQETTRMHQNNSQNLYTAGLDIRNLSNTMRALQDQVQEINNNITESNNRVRASLEIMTRDIQELGNTSTNQTNQIATIYEILQGIDNRIPVQDDDANSVSSLTTVSIRSFGENIGHRAQSSRRNVSPSRRREPSPGIPEPRRPYNRIPSPEPFPRQPREERHHNRSRSNSPALPKEAQIKRPDPFKGKKGKEAETFMLQMEIYFRSYGRTFNDQRKIATFLINLKDGASGWARIRLQKINADDWTGELLTWQTFRMAFLKHFGETMREEKAGERLDRLHQTKSASDYVTAFQEIAEELPDNEASLIRKFKKGLKEDVQKAAVQAEIHNPTRIWELQDWYDFAIRTDEILFQASRNANRYEKDKKGKTTQGRAATIETGKASNYTDEPKRRDSNSLNWVPQEVTERRKKEGKCIKCGRNGHRIPTCKSKEWVQEKDEKKDYKGKAAETGHISEEEEEETESTESEN